MKYLSKGEAYYEVYKGLSEFRGAPKCSSNPHDIFKKVLALNTIWLHNERILLYSMCTCTLIQAMSTLFFHLMISSPHTSVFMQALLFPWITHVTSSGIQNPFRKEMSSI